MPLPDFDMLAAGFSIRPASAGDAKACRMLLSTSGADSHHFVAVTGAERLVIGAGAITTACRPKPLPGLGAMIHVIAPCRRQGVGAALCAELMRLARSHGMQALYAARKSEVDGEETLGWQRLGFIPCETVEEHQLPLAQFVPRLEPLMATLHRLGRIPPEARIIPLYAADRGQVLQLHLDHLGGERGPLYQKIYGRGPGAFHPRYSRVLLVGERMIGCILAHRQSPQVAVVDANIVIPEFRGDWANVWLKLEATQGALALGITHFHFTSFDHYADTRAFAGKLGGVTTRKLMLMHRPLE